MKANQNSRRKPKKWCKFPLLRSLQINGPGKKLPRCCRLPVAVQILPAPGTSNYAHLLWDAGPRYKLDNVVPTLPYTTGDGTQHLTLPNKTRSTTLTKHQLRKECFAYLGHRSWSMHALVANPRWPRNFSWSLHRTCEKEALTAFNPLRPPNSSQVTLLYSHVHNSRLQMLQALWCLFLPALFTII